MAINLKICPMKNPVFFQHGSRLLLALIITVSLSFAQTRTNAQEIAQQPASPFNIGIGFGLDYGGLGISVNYLPVKPLGLFAGLGYNLLGMGYNAIHGIFGKSDNGVFFRDNDGVVQKHEKAFVDRDSGQFLLTALFYLGGKL